jgi:hypothetical protein
MCRKRDPHSPVPVRIEDLFAGTASLEGVYMIRSLCTPSLPNINQVRNKVMEFQQPLGALDTYACLGKDRPASRLLL